MLVERLIRRGTSEIKEIRENCKMENSASCVIAGRLFNFRNKIRQAKLTEWPLSRHRDLCRNDASK
jgi:hypothetical protein